MCKAMSWWRKLPQLVTPGIGKVRAYVPTNTLIVSDLGSNITRILEIIENIDVDMRSQQREVIKIEHTDVKSFAELIKQIIGDEGNVANNTRNRRRPPRGRRNLGGNLGSPMSHRVIPDERTNSLIVVGESCRDRPHQTIGEAARF